MDYQTADLLGFIAEIADGLLLNIPSNALLEDISREYNISVAKASQVYSNLQTMVGNNEDELAKIRDKKYSLQSLISMYPGMGSVTNSIRREMGILDDQEIKAKAALEKSKSKLLEQEAKIREIESNVPTLKTEIRRVLTE